MFGSNTTFQAVLSGGQQFAATWSPASRNGTAIPGVFVTDVPGTVANFTQLYVDGRREIRCTFGSMLPCDWIGILQLSLGD